MGLATIDPRSLKEHTEIHKIPKFGGSIVANPIIYRLVPSPSRYEIRQCPRGRARTLRTRPLDPGDEPSNHKTTTPPPYITKRVEFWNPAESFY